MLALRVPNLTLSDLEASGTLDLETLTPPPRFSETRFDSYRPQHPSQAIARDTVAAFVAETSTAPGFRWPWQAPPQGRGLYLDGSFGVGKTHLLAAAFEAAPYPEKIYLSFQELVYLIGVLGPGRARAELSAYQLYCIDEFELDDPGNTLIVKTFLDAVFARGGAVVTTSNTPPEAQGMGRFNADDFQREIQSIATRFRIQTIEGPDYRLRNRRSGSLTEAALRSRLVATTRGGVLADWVTFLAFLKSIHPIHYRPALQPVELLQLDGVAPIVDQNDALRFVHFVDKLYDLNIGLEASGSIELSRLFDPSYRHGAFAKKYDRCLSRLRELFEESGADAASG